MTPKLERTKTPGIFKAGDRYRIVVNGKKATADNMDDAKTKQAEMRLAQKEDLGAIRQSPTVAEYFEIWMPTQVHLRQATAARYAWGMHKYVLPKVGKIQLDALKASDIVRLYESLLLELKRQSIISTVAPLKSMLTHAVGRDLIPSNVAKEVPLASVIPAPRGEERVRALDESDLNKLLSHCDERYHLFLTFMAQTGLRISEAVAIRWSDLDGNKITVNRRWYFRNFDKPKSGKSRVVPISSRLAERLAEWNRESLEHRTPSDLIFPDPTGRCWDDWTLSCLALKPAVKAAGLKDVTWHTLRHTAASIWCQHLTLLQVSRYLGHTNTSFTAKTYAAWFPANDPSMDFFEENSPILPQTQGVA